MDQSNDSLALSIEQKLRRAVKEKCSQTKLSKAFSFS